MAYRVVFLHQAALDLKEIKKYMIMHFSSESWRKSYIKIKKAVKALELFPTAGSVPPELEVLNLTFYRQVISGKNRIIYEIRGQIVYIHIVCDTRKDMGTVLARRLVR